MADVAAVRYAAALYDAAIEGERLAKVYDDVVLLKELLIENVEFLSVLKHPKVGLTEKKAIISNAFAESFDEFTINLLNIVADKGRVGILSEIIDSFIGLYKKNEGIVDVQVKTAASLSDEQKQKLVDVLSAKLNKKVVLDCKVDKTLIGGMIITAEGKVIDYSVKCDLSHMRRYINEISI